MAKILIGTTMDQISRARTLKAVAQMKRKLPELEEEYIQLEEECGMKVLLQAIQDRKVQLAAVDTSIYRKFLRSNTIDYNQVAAVGLLRRGDPEYLLVTGRKHARHITHADILVHCREDGYQLSDLYEGVRCKVTDADCLKMLDAVYEENADAALITMDEFRLLKLEKRSGLSYHVLNPERIVPDSGQAVITLLAARGSEAYRMASEASHLKTVKEFSIEQEIVKKAGKLNSEIVSSLRVYARIEREHLDIYIYIRAYGHATRLKGHGNFEDRNLLIRRMATKIKKIVEY